MWPFGKIACQACGEAFPKAEMLLSPQKRGFGVCRGCAERWRRSGAKCVRCNYQVAATQHVAFFEGSTGFGHFDCGGIPI